MHHFKDPVGEVVLVRKLEESGNNYTPIRRFSTICIDGGRLYGMNGHIDVIDCDCSLRPDILVNPENYTSATARQPSTAGKPTLIQEPLPVTKPRSQDPPRPEIRRTLEKSADTDSNFDLLNKWIQNCTKNHRYCTSRTSYTPTRLLDTGELNDPSTIRLVLCDPQGQQYRYMALSHCWGLASTSVKDLISTTAGNLPSRLEGFPLENMPQTFQDAIYVTKRLGARYIWIDSLCIIQDSAKDWEKESAVMDKVYSFAYATIVAAKAKNPSEGLFQNRDDIPTAVSIDSVKGCQVGYKAGSVLDISLHPVLPTTRALIQSGPLATRGWALQERQLSRRLVHFTTHQVLWECSCSIASEIYPEGGFGGPHFDFAVRSARETGPSQTRVLKRRHLMGEIMTDPIYFWTKIVEDFTRRKFTFSQDRLSALSGMNAAISASSNNYLAGLWRPSLLPTLFWEVSKRSTLPPTRPEQYLAPSWSWASVEGAVDFSSEYDKVSGYSSNNLEILEATITASSTRNPMGNVSSGFLRVRGFLRMGICLKQQNLPGLQEQDDSGTGSILDVETRQIQGPIQCDVSAEIKSEQTVYCLFGYSCEGLFDDKVYAGLALLPTGRQVNEYQRVGVVKLPIAFWSIEAGLAKQTFTIV